MNVVVSQLAVYPVKSTRQISLTRCELDAFGFRGDRRWMVVTPEGRFITQRQRAEMVLINVANESLNIQLSAPDMPAINVSFPDETEAATRQVTVWDDEVMALDAGNTAADWLSRFLKIECRLVYMPDSTFRQVDRRYAPKGRQTGFADGFPLLLISEGSLDLLNQKLKTPVPMARFRPNLVVKGCEPHAEDLWRCIKVGDIDFEVVKPCTRCVIPSINTDTAEKDSELLKVLADYRRDEKSRVIFGMNLIHRNRGNINVGDSVTVIE